MDSETLDRRIERMTNANVWIPSGAASGFEQLTAEMGAAYAPAPEMLCSFPDSKWGFRPSPWRAFASEERFFLVRPSLRGALIVSGGMEESESPYLLPVLPFVEHVNNVTSHVEGLVASMGYRMREGIGKGVAGAAAANLLYHMVEHDLDLHIAFIDLLFGLGAGVYSKYLAHRANSTLTQTMTLTPPGIVDELSFGIYDRNHRLVFPPSLIEKLKIDLRQA